MIKEFGCIKSEFEPCVNRKFSGRDITFLVLYVNNILIIGNYAKILNDVKSWLSKYFQMRDLKEVAYILRIKNLINGSKRLIGPSQSIYVNKLLNWFKMEEFKKWIILLPTGTILNKLTKKTQNISWGLCSS